MPQEKLNIITSLFKGRTMVLASMHKKEMAMQAILEKELEVKLTVPSQFNTDIFGTFSGEIKRTSDSLDTAKLKSEKALEITGESLSISNEGSFVPHPSIPFATLNQEIIYLNDKKNNFNFYTIHHSTNTNASQAEITSTADAIDFATKHNFPSHGMIISSYNKKIIEKGIHTVEDLVQKTESIFKQFPDKAVIIENDLRAMHNPTRMLVIKEATQKLVNEIKTFCPHCGWIGFTVKEYRPGLPCENCNNPTKGILNTIRKCEKCNYNKTEMYPDNKKFSDPMYCDFCNP